MSYPGTTRKPECHPLFESRELEPAGVVVITLLNFETKIRHQSRVEKLLPGTWQQRESQHTFEIPLGNYAQRNLIALVDTVDNESM